jgi:hypothetical protein
VGSWQFALRTPTSGNTGFHRESFSSFARRSTKIVPCGDLRRLLTSRAHRLGKPHRTFEPLTSSVTRRSRRAALLRSPPRRTARAARPSASGPDDAAFRLKTTTPPGPGRLLLRVDPRPRSRSRLARAPFDVRPRSPRTRSSTANRSSGSQTGGPPRETTPPANRSIHPVPASRPGARVRRAVGKMRLPRSATDQLHEHPANRLNPDTTRERLARQSLA